MACSVNNRWISFWCAFFNAVSYLGEMDNVVIDKDIKTRMHDGNIKIKLHSKPKKKNRSGSIDNP